jgi:hypothetical protein
MVGTKMMIIIFDTRISGGVISCIGDNNNIIIVIISNMLTLRLPARTRLPERAGARYDVSPDGQRFYVIRMATPPPPPVVTHINLILNWFEELKGKVPPEH